MIFAKPRKACNAGPVANQRVFSTPAADQAISRLRARHGHLTLHHADGESGPVVHRPAERPLHAGRHEACIGIAGGAPFYVDYKQNAELGYPDYKLDVAATADDTAAVPRLVSHAIRKPTARR